jgi:hypothetical protein
VALDYPELLGGKYSPRLFKCDVCRECFLYKDGSTALGFLNVMFVGNVSCIKMA